MTSNLFSFCSSPISDILIVYIWCLSVFISVWVCLSLVINAFGSGEIGFRSFSRVSFDKVESILIFLFSVLIVLLIGINLIIIRSHVPWYYSVESYQGVKGSIGVVGRQWYWVYNLLSDHQSGENTYGVDSYITGLVDCVDNALNLSVHRVYSLNITSADVLHSFALPAAQLKVDAVPGRINNVYLLTNVYGRHVGYCSEFCGAGHSYMPIVINA
uniref:cytochrome c oxidase subunit II n=1 Tax=Hexostoma thynni TaxID=92220 RepID=UPI0022385F20|nr:cytochrome c oxidase subunit II [Hexostoma thynni]UYC28896.1 cytochrome c oxidase subunit II [Hexostoma thynni]